MIEPFAFQYRFVNPAPSAPLAEAGEGAEFAVQLCQDTPALPPSLIVFRQMSVSLRLDERDVVWRDVPHPENLLNQVWCDRLIHGHRK